MRIGYARISKADGSQVLNLQRDALLAAGVRAEHLYEDRASGTTEDRPALAACLKALRQGDTLVVWQLDRLGRHLKHLVNTVQDLAAYRECFPGRDDTAREMTHAAHHRPPPRLSRGDTMQETRMCRNIKTLFNFEPPVTEEEIHMASLQFVRKVSGFNTPSKANVAAFFAAVDEIAAVTSTLLSALERNAPPKHRTAEAAKARARAAQRFSKGTEA